ncbi:MAG: hypothetical protein LLF86_08265 [Nitrospiraceae bacterium]|nr:hypothetical protein [Nitrospiraceae bacterium]
MLNNIKPFSTTGIGSLPHLNADEAVDLILNTFDIPFWPQLPMLSFRESMTLQYAEGMPFLKIDELKETAWVEHGSGDDLTRFYESYTESSKIAVSEDCAAGLHAFLRRIKGRRFPFLKGHVTGPITFTLGLKDSSGRYLFFDEEMREISSMLLKAKIRWQIDALKQHADNVIIFIDEPILSALGSSSYLGVDTAEVQRLLSEAVSAIEEAGGIPGIHCCGRADWPAVIQTGAKIINFDAFEYFDTLVMYEKELAEFMSRGGYLAFGIVPTSDSINTVTEDRLLSLMLDELNRLRNVVKDSEAANRILITPSCGTGSRSIEEAVKIFQMTIRLKEALS